LKYKITNDGLTAEFKDGKISLFIPEEFIKDWAVNDVVGLNSNVRINDYEQLHLLVEKDFKCIDGTTEDQSDNFDNPNISCNE
jgi:hypothetical protein